MAATTEVQEGRPLLDTLQAIRTRRAVKEYLDKPIPKEWIEELLDAVIDPIKDFAPVMRIRARLEVARELVDPHIPLDLRGTMATDTMLL